MKKLLALILACLMVFSLCACKKDGEQTTETTETAETTGTSFDAVNGFCNARVKCDVKTIVELSVDPHAFKMGIEKGTYKDENHMMDVCEDFYTKAHDDLEEEFGSNLTVEVEEERTATYGKGKVDKLNEYLAQEQGYPENYISELEIVRVKVDLKGDKKEDTQSVEYVVAKIDGKWYVTTFPNAYHKESIDSIIQNR